LTAQKEGCHQRTLREKNITKTYHLWTLVPVQLIQILHIQLSVRQNNKKN